MSTELKSVKMQSAPDVSLTRFWGGKDRGACVQLTQLTLGAVPTPFHFMQFTKPEALEMAKALLEFATDSREEAE